MVIKNIKTDIAICGGGISGALAGISAARSGADVTVIERGGCLGGTLTASLVGIILDGNKKCGLVEEFITRLSDLQKQGFAVIEESEKYLLEAMCREAGVNILYYTSVKGCVMGNGNIISISAQTYDCEVTIEPRIVIDATGNGSLAAMAGCGYDVGDENGRTQPMSMGALVGGVPEEFIGWERRNRFKEFLTEQGCNTSLGFPNLTNVGRGYCTLGINHEYGIAFNNVKDVSEAVIHARREIFETVKLLSQTREFSNIVLLSTPELIGIRESRRIHCKYTVTLDDILSGRRHEDSICRVTYWVDIHALDGNGDKSYTGDDIKCLPYDVPLRALLPIDVENLIVTGRAICGDFYAHASYRVAGNCAAFGEAAGVEAARRVREGQ